VDPEVKVRLILVIEVEGISLTQFNALPEEKKQDLMQKLRNYPGGTVEKVEFVPD